MPTARLATTNKPLVVTRKVVQLPSLVLLCKPHREAVKLVPWASTLTRQLQSVSIALLATFVTQLLEVEWPPVLLVELVNTHPVELEMLFALIALVESCRH